MTNRQNRVEGESFREFLASSDTLRVYRGERLIFASAKDRLRPLLEYVSRFPSGEEGVTIFDRVVGNAAALLFARIFCPEVYSPLGSELAAKTLKRFGIAYHFLETVPYIQNSSGEDMCPMEKLSLDKDPGEFYRACLSLGLVDGL